MGCTILCMHAGSGRALDAQVDWASSLSLGEQQRVAWARLLLARPRLALLDEASSALDQTTEEELYQVCDACLQFNLTEYFRCSHLCVVIRR
jgi:ABC-type uncharacterized transport system fused permease/ATPase subunit